MDSRTQKVVAICNTGIENKISRLEKEIDKLKAEIYDLLDERKNLSLQIKINRHYIKSKKLYI